MQPAPPPRAGEPDEPGMSEQAASYAVLGADIEAIGAAVARHWGLDDAVLHLIRRLPLRTPPRTIDNDDDMLRAVASCANEAVDALALPAARRQAALQRVAQRYARALAHRACATCSRRCTSAGSPHASPSGDEVRAEAGSAAQA